MNALWLAGTLPTHTRAGIHTDLPTLTTLDTGRPTVALRGNNQRGATRRKLGVVQERSSMQVGGRDALSSLLIAAARPLP